MSFTYERKLSTANYYDKYYVCSKCIKKPWQLTVNSTIIQLIHTTLYWTKKYVKTNLRASLFTAHLSVNVTADKWKKKLNITLWTNILKNSLSTIARHGSLWLEKYTYRMGSIIFYFILFFNYCGVWWRRLYNGRTTFRLSTQSKANPQINIRGTHWNSIE